MISLTPPNLDSNNIARLTSCIRPKRFGGARIEVERCGKTLIIHNYGHGGFGWTLLPGSVFHALQLFEQAVRQDQNFLTSKKITVVGAGCMGLLTAILLHEKGYHVTIVASHRDNLASHKAAGSVAVISIKASAANQRLMDDVAVQSYVYYKKLAYSANPDFLGVRALPVYMIHQGTPDYHYPCIKAGIMPEREEVMINFGNSVVYKAQKYNTFFVDTQLFMQQLSEKVSAYNINIIQNTVINLCHTGSDIVFNCSGLGSRVWDPAIIPVQGHLIEMCNQPKESLDYILYAHVKMDGRLQEISWTPKNGGLLGGSAINGEERLDANPHYYDLLIDRARCFFNSRGT